MKKVLLVILSLCFVIGACPKMVSASEGGDELRGGTYISRIGLLNDSEFVEIYNTGGDLRVEGLEVILNGAEKKVVAVGSGVFRAGEYLTLTGWLGNQVVTSGDIELKIDGVAVDKVCLGTMSGCGEDFGFSGSTTGLANSVLEGCFVGGARVKCAANSERQFNMIGYEGLVFRDGGFEEDEQPIICEEGFELIGGECVEAIDPAVCGEGLILVEGECVLEEKKFPTVGGIILAAVNAGWTPSGGMVNTDDSIVLYNTNSETTSLAGWSVWKGNVRLFEFSNYAYVRGESFVVLRFNSGGSAGQVADERYGNSGLAAASGRVSVTNGTEMDEVCWGEEGCYEKFSGGGKSLARCIENGIVGYCDDDEHEFMMQDFVPEMGGYFLDLPEVMIEEAARCDGLVVNEIYSRYKNSASEQFIEFYNTTDEIIELKGCGLRIRAGSSNNVSGFTFSDGAVVDGGYYAFYNDGKIKLTANPSGENAMWLVNSDGEEVLGSRATWAKGQKIQASWAYFDEGWSSTYVLTPGAENVAAICPVGKVINPATGKCINEKEDEGLPDCGPGKFRNPETNRCKSLTSLATVLAPCADGYYRNPETNRCKKIATASGPAPCADGWERNPETGRCRKIRENKGAEYALDESGAGKWAFVGWGAVGVVLLGGILVMVWQFREEIGRGLGKVFRRSGKK